MSKRAAAAKQRIQQFYFQLTEGCGRSNCSNADCASNPSFEKVSSDEAAARAMIMFKNKVALCEKPPSKVPRTDSDESEIEHDALNLKASEKSEDDFSNGTSQDKLHNGKETVEVNDTDNKSEKPALTSEDSDKTTKSVVKKKNESSSSNIEPDCLSASMCDQPSCDDNINKKLQNIFVTKPMDKTNAKDSQKRDMTCLCETIEEALDMLKHLTETSELNGLLGTIKDSLWKVFSNPDYLNMFALLKEDILLQLVNEEDKNVNETKLKNTNASKISMDDLDNDIPETSNGSTASKDSDKKKSRVIYPTVNMDIVRLLYKQCSDYEQLVTVMLNAIAYLVNEIERQLTSKKEAYLHDPNYLNMFVIIMENPAIQSPEALEKTFPSFCKVLSRLPIPAQAALARYWSKYDQSLLQSIIESLQQLITFKVVSEIDGSEMPRGDANSNEGVTAASKCLNIFFYASILGGKIDKEENDSGAEKSVKIRENSKKNSDVLGLSFMTDDDHHTWVDPLGKALQVKKLDSLIPLVPFSEFINEPLNEVIKIEKDYTNYKINQHGSSIFSFLHYPFLLNTVNKHTHLFYDNRITMYSERRRTFVSSLVQGELLHPYLRINVRRNHIIEDTLIQLEYASESDFKKQLFVEFDKEEGVDEGGVSKEFFQLIIDEIFNPENGVFIYDDDTHLFWFNSHSFEALTQYKLIGIVFGLAIYNNCILDVNFPPLVYKKLLGKKAHFLDVEHFQPVLYKSLRDLLDYEGDVEEDLMLTFRVEYQDVFGSVHHHDLKENAETLHVTSENRQEYVDLYVDWMLNSSVSKQFNAFLSGFDLVVSDSLLKYLFDYKELELLIRGSKDFDFEELQRTTEYDGGFTKSSQTVVDFWQVVHDLTEEEKRSLLQFSTGSDRAPVGGLAKLKMVIARNGPDSNRLPTAHTCFNVILLPDYKNKEKLRERLLKAIKYSKGFGML